MTGIDDEPRNTEKNLATPESSRGNVIIAQDEMILEMAKELQMLKEELAAVKGKTPQNTPLCGHVASHSLGQIGESLNPTDGVVTMNTPLNTHNAQKAPAHQSNLPLAQAPPPNNSQSSQTPPTQQDAQPTSYYSYYPPPNTALHYQYLPVKDTPRPAQPKAPIVVATAPQNANDPRHGYPEAQYYEPDPNGKNVDFTEYAPQTEVPIIVEKQVKTAEQEEMIQKMKVMEQSIKNLQGSRGRHGISYRNLYLYPDIAPPPGFKLPKFDMYNGHGDPFSHLTKYLNRMRVAGGKEELLMAYFSHSLEGVAAEWFARQDISKWHEFDDIANDFTKQFEYNVEMVPDLITLANLKKKPTEAFREYALRWREQAARVQPPMTEEDMVKYFIRAQDDSYYMHLLPMMDKPFSKLLMMGEMVEEGVKTGRIVSFAEMKTTAQNAQAGTSNARRKEKKEEVTAVVADANRRPARRINFDSPTGYQNVPPPYQNATPPYPNAPLNPSHYQIPPAPYPVYQAQPNYYPSRAPAPPQYPRQPNYQTTPNFQAPQNYQPRAPVRPNMQGPNQNYERRPPKTYTPLAESYSQLFERLRNAGVVQPVPDNTPNPPPRWYDANKHCAYHSGAAGHDIERCFTFKDRVEALIRAGTIQLTGTQPNVHDNPLPVHGNNAINMISIDEEMDLKGTIVPVSNVKVADTTKISVQAQTPILVQAGTPKPMVTIMVASRPHYDNKRVPWNYSEVPIGSGKIVVAVATAHGMTRSGRCYVPENLGQEIGAKESNVRKVTDAEAEEFWRKMQSKDYSILEHLRNTLARISIMSLLMNSEMHRTALLKVLNEAQVPAETTGESLATLVGQILESHKVSFFKEELPPEGVGHNKALHITIQCRDKLIGRVLIDGGSGLNICPLTTLKELGIDVGKIRQSNVKARAFDGAQRSTIGEVDLELQVGPVSFTVEFQVFDIPSTYNMLLGRPWIHMAGAVPSTLHQSVKFIWNNEEIVVKGEGSNSIYAGNTIPMVDNTTELDGTTFHTVELMNVTRASDDNQRKLLPKVPKMIASEMLKNGFKPGLGLGANLNGITEPVSLPKNLGTFGLGYRPTKEEVDKAKSKKKPPIIIPKPLPSLCQSFVKAPEAAVPDLIESMGNLFVNEEWECSAIIEYFEEESSIQNAEPRDLMANWTCLPIEETW